jgi:signal transduction histidine kinase
VLAALFAEREENEARLARSNMMLERERSNKLMSLAAMAAAISHEMKQPLTAVTANGIAAVRLLQGESADVAEARSAVDDVVSDAYRAAEVLDSLRGLFGKVDRVREPIDLNEAALAALRTLRSELGDHGIKTGLDLAPGLPRVMGNKGQLQEAITNLLHNAIEAMQPVKVDRRILNVSTRPDSEAVVIEVKDSGPGIDPPLLENIFDAFVTTKPHGTGLGLAICRMIAERHGGRLSAMSDGKNGALFQLILPIPSAESAERA